MRTHQAFVISVLLLLIGRFAAPTAVVRAAEAMGGVRRAVSREHPRMLGSLDELRKLAKERPEAYERLARVARGNEEDDYSRVISMGLVGCIEGDESLAAKIKQVALKYVRGPIRQGHVSFATDLAICGLAFDLGHAAWSESETAELNNYVNRTVEANVESEPHVFHNGWYGYKNWGIGVACYATYYENRRAQKILQELEKEFRSRAAPALELAGNGGGWAEGYYIHYWLYEWLFFCEVARRCQGVDYYAVAPSFFARRAVASMFETYPGIDNYGSRRCAPMGDGGGRLFGGDRDKALSARRILVNYYRSDPVHQAVHAFNETTPRSSVGLYAYKDFLWRDSTVRAGDLKNFRLSHFSPGAGYVHARSSWGEDATWFFFKCGDRFTTHQHLDVGHFLIYKHEELAGDGGHYDAFGSQHDVNYHLRTIAHNAILVRDPNERWPGMRAGKVVVNDGGERHPWKHHNGATADVPDWERQRVACDIADMLAFEDTGPVVYMAGDATRAYSTAKVSRVTRQIVFLRPNTFVIFDRVTSTRPEFKKTWVLQAMHTPRREGQHLIVENGKGRLFVQSLLPVSPEVRLVSGKDLYELDGRDWSPKGKTGPAPECRIEICPTVGRTNDYFLHVLTAGDSTTLAAPIAECSTKGSRVAVKIGPMRIGFSTDEISAELNGETLRSGSKP